jgi:hypothetical protein
MGWYNSDGLYVKFSTEEATAGRAGEYLMTGPQQMTELVIDPMTALTTTAVVQDYNLVIPKNARIEKVEVITTTGATGGTSLSIGTIDTDYTSNAADGGLVNAALLATHDAAGETTVLTLGATGAGTLIGTTLTANKAITAKCAGTYTAGAVRVRIYYVRAVA